MIFTKNIVHIFIYTRRYVIIEYNKCLNKERYSKEEKWRYCTEVNQKDNVIIQDNMIRNKKQKKNDGNGKSNYHEIVLDSHSGYCRSIQITH